MRKILFSAFLSILMSGAAFSQEPSSYGTFIGNLDLRLDRNGRFATVLSNFVFKDKQNNEWLAPAGAIVDGASIPSFLWSVVGSPWTGKYREASVIHDVFCERRTKSWKDVHRIFYYGMLANGVDKTQAKIMYSAVYRFGPRWNFEYTPKCKNCAAIPYTVEFYKSPFDKTLYKKVSKKIKDNPTVSIDTLEAEADSLVAEELTVLQAGRPTQ